MGDMLSQAEIEALLNGNMTAEPNGGQAADAGAGQAPDETADAAGAAENAQAGMADADAEEQYDGLIKEFIIGDDPSNDFTTEEIDALGEIGNISMGNSATTLFTLLNRKVNITTPRVTVSTLKQISESYRAPLVVVRVEYTKGFDGTNMLVLKESDVMAITDLMMGGDGSGISGELSELHLSAISEAMNQMIGNASTSLSNVFDKLIDISPPNATSVKINDGQSLLQTVNIDPEAKVAVVSFRMIVEDLLDTMLMQIQPLDFAKGMIRDLMESQTQSAAQPAQQPAQPAPQQPDPYAQPLPPQYQQPVPPGYPQYPYPPDMPPQYQQAPYMPPPQYMQPPPYAPPPRYVNVQPANFQQFEDETVMIDKKNIGLVMDVNLEVSVELGRTHKLIRDILEFGQGTIIELDKMAGEPVDILVNNKNIAKGEVVVIDESFGVRVTDIIHPAKRIS